MKKHGVFLIVHIRQEFRRTFFKIETDHKTNVVSDRLYPSELADMQNLKI